MIRIGCITFHAAHNYGSCLQAYALKYVFEKIIGNVEYEIINYRNVVQKNFYQSEFEKRDVKSVYSRAFMIGHKEEIKKKHILFEEFITKYLEIGIEYNNTSDVKDTLDRYNILIAGSDQIWNVNAFEFSEIYFLPKLDCSGIKYTYAVSIGSKDNIIENNLSNKIAKWLLDYSVLSVRDQRTKDFLIEICGQKIKERIRFDCDPTLLISKENWLELIKSSKVSIPNYKYILFYDLSRNKENWELASKISKKLNIPLLITSVPFPRVINKSVSCNIRKKMDVGPIEWLALINKAELVISSSFHGTVFSVLLDKPFYSINTKEDNRVSFFLSSLGLLDRIVDKNNINNICSIPSIDNQILAHKKISEIKKDSLLYLREIVNS